MTFAAEWLKIPTGNPRFAFFETSALYMMTIYVYLLTGVVLLFKFLSLTWRHQTRRLSNATAQDGGRER